MRDGERVGECYLSPAPTSAQCGWESRLGEYSIRGRRRSEWSYRAQSFGATMNGTCLVADNVLLLLLSTWHT